MASALPDRHVLIQNLSEMPADFMAAFAPSDHLRFKRKPAIARRPASNAFDLLSKLPERVVHNILSKTSLKDVGELRKVCLSAYHATESLPFYALMAKHSPETISILSKLGVDKHWTIEQLTATLHTDRCSSCERYGALFSLLTCERCCYHCLRNKPKYWAIQGPIAEERIMRDRLRELPSLRCNSGNRLYNIMAVRQLEPDEQDSGNFWLRADESEFKPFRAWSMEHDRGDLLDHWLVNAPPFSTKIPNCYEFGLWGAVRDDPYHLMLCRIAATPWPIIHTEKRNMGYWCRGCIRQEPGFTKVYSRRPDGQILGVCVDDPPSPDFPTRWEEFKAYSEEEFVQHISVCRWVQPLVTQLQDRPDRRPEFEGVRKAAAYRVQYPSNDLKLKMEAEAEMKRAWADYYANIARGAQ